MTPTSRIVELEAKIGTLHELLEVQDSVVAEQAARLRDERDRLAVAEERARRDEEKMRLVLAAARNAIIRIERGALAYWNDAAAALFRRPELPAGTPFLDLVAPESKAKAAAAFAAATEGAGAPSFEARFVAGDGSSFLGECAVGSSSATPDDLVVSVRDVTTARLLEEEQRQAMKLEAVGRLASGIAHEINTPVQFVSDSVRFIHDAISDVRRIHADYHALVEKALQLPELEEMARAIGNTEENVDLAFIDEEFPRATARALDGLQRVADLVAAMKEFAHPERREKTATDLNRSIQSTLTVARNETKYVADVVTEFGKLPAVRCHPGEINQAVLNIVVNAAHAIGDVVAGTERRGTIRVQTAVDGAWAVIRISDDGGGIPEAIRSRIFDPFFTTKAVGRGTGQGLAIARSVIVEKHHGRISVESELGTGTTFELRLPLDGDEDD